jgi:predicted transposase YbfD/YdcC
MDHSTEGEDRPFFEDGFILDLDSLYARFETLQDQRKARGKRYPLVIVLIVAVLAKLSGEDSPEGVAEWGRARASRLCQALSFARGKLPSGNTSRRVLGAALSVEELEEVVRAFLKQPPGAGQSVLVSLDGKTLRGTIPTGSTQGVHLLSAYLPAEGLVLMQVAVESKENEISAAPRILEVLDLRGKVVVGDAMFTQRELSAQVVAGGGEYVWFVKDNQPATCAAIEALFQEPTGVEDLQVAQSVNKGHGRVETRRLLSSTLLKGYLAWPHLTQVFKLERRAENLQGQLLRQKTVYGLTSLQRNEANAHALLGYTRGYWGIENGLHYRRDKTLHEDATRMSNPRLAHSLAAINNLVLGLSLRQGWQRLPKARRHYDAHPEQALRLVLRAPT